MKPDPFCQILDANLNRASEGLRVCEEVARFILKSPSFTRRCQHLRYALRHQVKGFQMPALISYRDIRRDAGRPSLRGEPCSHRNLADVVCANARRTGEALRVIEEVGRLMKPKAAFPFSHLRFQVYQLEKALLSKLSALRYS